MAWHIQPEARRFIKRVTDKVRIVLLTATADRYWKAHIPGFDAMTSASVIDEAEAASLSDQLLLAVHKRLADS
jgi:hypothetical protein